MSLLIPTKIRLKKSHKYVHSLDPNGIQELDQDIKSNGWGVKKVLDIENTLNLLAIFQSFYHNTGHFPLTNGLLLSLTVTRQMEKKKCTD